MNDTSRLHSDDQQVTLVFDLEDAEALVAMLGDVCQRMRQEGRDDGAPVELTMALPREALSDAYDMDPDTEGR